MLELVNRPNDISLSRATQLQAKFKSTVSGDLLQSWVNLTVVKTQESKLLIDGWLLLGKFSKFSATRRDSRHQNKVKVKGLGRNSSY